MKTARDARLRASKEVYDKHKRKKKLETIIFNKGPRRGVLSLGETTMAWIVFEDPSMSKHVDWNDPDCLPEYQQERLSISPLHFCDLLTKKGWKLAWGKDE